MSENPKFNPGPSAELPPPVEAIWDNGESKVPVKVVGYKSSTKGEFAILDNNEAVPISQVTEIDPSSEVAEAAENVGETSMEEAAEHEPDVDDFEPGQKVSRWHKGKLKEGWVVDTQDNYYPDMVKIKREDGTMEGTYAPPDILIPAEVVPTEHESKQEEVAEEAGELATEQVVEEPYKPHKYKHGEVKKVPLKGGERSAIISKTGQEVVVVKDDIVKDEKPFVRLASGREIPKEDVEYSRWSDDFEGEEFIFVRKPGEDESVFTVKEQAVEFSVQYKDGIRYVYLEGLDEHGNPKIIKARPSELVQQTHLPQGYWRKVGSEADKTQEAETEPNIASPDEAAEQKKNEETPETNPEKQKAGFKFKKGEIVKVRTKDGKKEFDWEVNRSFKGKSEIIYVRLIDPNGKLPERVVPQEKLEEWNPRSSDQQTAPETQLSQDQVENADADVDKDSDDNNDVPEIEHDVDNDPWLDPRRIQELKAHYNEVIQAAKNELGFEITQEYRDIVKTHVIESAIRKVIHHGEYVANKHKVSEAPQTPSEEIKLKMAEMLDLSDGQINKMAEKADERANEKDVGFAPGQRVKIVNSNKSVSEDWVVDKVQQHYRHGDVGVWVTNGKEKRWYAVDKLREFQEQAEPDQEKLILESLKPYFNGAAKIKTTEGLIEGQFQGYKVANRHVYVGDSSGKRLGEVPVEDFLSWQEQKTEAEKLAELEAKLAPYLDETIQIINSEGKLVAGKVEYLKEEGKVNLVSDQGVEYEYTLMDFIKAQEKAAEKLKRIDDEIPATERSFSINQSVKVINGATIERGWIVDDYRKEDGDIVVHLVKGGERMDVNQELLKNWQLVPDDHTPSIESSGEPSGGSGEPITVAEGPKVPKTLKEMMGGPSSSWWESTNRHWEGLPNNAAKAAEFAGGIVLLSTGLGLGIGASMAFQHKLHKRRLKKIKERENAAAEERRIREPATAGRPII